MALTSILRSMARIGLLAVLLLVVLPVTPTAKHGVRAIDPTIAELLKPHGYCFGQIKDKIQFATGR